MTDFYRQGLKRAMWDWREVFRKRAKDRTNGRAEKRRARRVASREIAAEVSP